MSLNNVRGTIAWNSARAAEGSRVINGKAIAAKLRAEIAQEVDQCVKQTGKRPGLATILIGDDPASAIYVAGKHKACHEVGIETFNYRLAGDVGLAQVEHLIGRLNNDDSISGILCQLPVPAHLDGVRITRLVAADKDVDGLGPASIGLLQLGLDGLRPCTPAGVMVLLEDAGVELQGAEAVVIGRSNLFGKPMAQMLLAANATVTVAHACTVDLPTVCRRADLLIVAVGRDRMVKADWVRTGATVIDVGINRSPDGLHGDVDFDAVRHVASAITPVPGGVGPMTIAMLLRNTLRAATMHKRVAVTEQTAPGSSRSARP
jgi:methylenetetrahydrofolate dehydrogenase (NADP+)/methenyltetrahydrofolate cyclohydrolase